MPGCLSRRSAVAGVVALGAAGLGCGRKEREGSGVTASGPQARASAGAAAPPSSESNGGRRGPADHVRAQTAGHGGPALALSVRELDGPPAPWGTEKVVLLSSDASRPGERLPLLVALHGRGESLRGVDAGAYGWLRDYDLGHAFARLRAPPLTRDDFLGFVSGARLAALNESLAAEPFRGLAVVCPFVPDVLDRGARSPLDEALAFADWTVQKLLPRVLSENLLAAAAPSATGIDGVSLGGRVALVTGLAHPERFGAIGTLQPAIQRVEVPELARRIMAARARRPSLDLRLLTSDGDAFREPIAALHTLLLQRGIAHDYAVAEGPHDYVFNRGPGAIEMLLWHDRVLRGKTPV